MALERPMLTNLPRYFLHLYIASHCGGPSHGTCDISLTSSAKPTLKLCGIWDQQNKYIAQIPNSKYCMLLWKCINRRFLSTQPSAERISLHLLRFPVVCANLPQWSNQVDMQYTLRLSTTHIARNIGVQTPNMMTAVLSTVRLRLTLQVCSSRNKTD